MPRSLQEARPVLNAQSYMGPVQQVSAGFAFSLFLTDKGAVSLLPLWLT